MKRLGTRLGMMTGVIGLAVMAITQAQKDYSVNSGTQEFADLNAQLTPPRPIGIDGSEQTTWPAPPDTHVIRGSDNAIASIPSTSTSLADSAIQLAAHTDAPTDHAAASVPARFSMPTVTTTDSVATQDSASEPMQAFDLPATLPPSDTHATVGSGVASDRSNEAQPILGTPPMGNGSAVPSIQIPDEAFGTASLGAPAPQMSAPTAASIVATPNTPAPEPNPVQQQPIAQTGIGIQGGDLVDMPQGFQNSPSNPSSPPNTRTQSLTAPGFAISRDATARPTATPQPLRAPDANPAPAVPPAAIVPQPYEPAPRVAEAPRPRREPMQQNSRGPSSAEIPPSATGVLPQPGSRMLEGAQSPSVTIHKRAPEEVNVGKQATFAIQIRNTGATEALNVVVSDVVPEGMELIEAVPQPDLRGNQMTWTFGELEPGGERTITLQMVPHTEGELGSVARLSFEAAASVRTLSTRPELKIVQRAPEQVLVGQQVEIEIEVSNPGTGTAYGVVLQEDVPEGLEHSKGRQLDNLLGDIQPGQTRRQRLVMKASRAGVVNNYIQLISEDEVVAKNSLPIEIVAPKLAVELDGPTRRFLERQAKYTLRIANQGTAMATNVDVVAYLDRGLSFVSTEFKGQYDSTRHAVFWSLAELPKGEIGEVPLVLLPIEPGEQLVRLEAQADLGIGAGSEKPITVETLAEITFSVNDDQDPIEAGATTNYAIRITNSGSREDTNVHLRIALPQGLEFVRADQQAQVDQRGIVSFAPLPRMSAQDEHTFRFTVRGRATGTHVLKAILTSDQSNVPVTKEESTMVYSDQ